MGVSMAMVRVDAPQPCCLRLCDGDGDPAATGAQPGTDAALVAGGPGTLRTARATGVTFAPARPSREANHSAR